MFWLGTKMVLIRIAKMLRGWLSMFKREVGVLLESRIVRMEELSRRPAQIEWKEEVATDLGTMVDSVMQALENKASQPPRNCWDGGMRSRLETLALQSSALGSVAVI